MKTSKETVKKNTQRFDEKHALALFVCLCKIFHLVFILVSFSLRYRHWWNRPLPWHSILERWMWMFNQTPFSFYFLFKILPSLSSHFLSSFVIFSWLFISNSIAPLYTEKEIALKHFIFVNIGGKWMKCKYLWENIKDSRKKSHRNIWLF